MTTIYLDMDGVLADFVQHTCNLGIPNNHHSWYEPRDQWTKETWEGERVKTKAMHSHGFWDTMPACTGAQRLWDFCEAYDHGVLTAKPQADSPALVGEDKLVWIRATLRPSRPYEFICCTREEKKIYAPGNILVDDDPRNCKTWEEHGGIAIYHSYEFERVGQSIQVVRQADVEGTIDRLKEILNG